MGNNKSSKKFKNHVRKRRAFWIVVILVIFVLFALAAFTRYGNNIISINKSYPTFTQGKGGDKKLVENGYEDAVATWRSGDHEKAKNIAKKALDENQKLTIKQQESIPNQIDKVYALYDISEGTYVGN